MNVAYSVRLSSSDGPRPTDGPRTLGSDSHTSVMRGGRLSLIKFVGRLVELEIETREALCQFIDSLPKQPNSGPELAEALVQSGRLTAYQATTILSGCGRGLRCGSYLIIDKIGEGSMGRVFKAIHCRLKRTVAIKFLPPNLAHQTDALQRFLREIHTTAQLNHPHIIAALDAEQVGRHFFLVTEYVEGVDLEQWVEDHHPLPVTEVLQYLLHAAEGLRYAHHRGFIHRDVKPANLLRDSNGTIKLLDLGLARPLPDHLVEAIEHKSISRLTMTGMIVGTAGFMAPEQALTPRQADHRVDIYALGCTLYYLLTKRAPYRAETILGQLLAHREEEIPKLRAERPDVPEAVEHLFANLVAKRPDDRLQSMKEVIGQLRALLEPHVKLPPSPSTSSLIKDPTPSMCDERKMTPELRAVWGRLGMRVFPLEASMAQLLGFTGGPCLVIEDVEKNSPAFRCGVKPFDLLLQIQGKAVPTAETLQNVMGLFPNNQKVTILIQRDVEGTFRRFNKVLQLR